MKMGEPVIPPHYKYKLKARAHIRTWDLTHDCVVCIFEAFGRIDLPDTLSSATFAGLNHNGPANLLRPLQAFVDTRHTGGVISLFGNGDETSIGQDCL